MKIFKRIKWSYVVLSVMFLLLGIYLVVNPETSLIMICRILGAAMAVFGVMKIVLYFIREDVYKRQIHDTVHEMARDEARHGKAFEGLLNRYFGK